MRYLYYILIFILFEIAFALLILFPYLQMVSSIICGLLFLLLLYLILKKEFEIPIPFSINFLLSLGIFADAVGNAFGFYGKKWGPLWFDSWMHLFVPFCLGFFFFWLLNFLRLKKKLNWGNFFIWLFGFSLVFSLAAFYEVIELWDELYFGGKRIWGIHDTSSDLQWAMIGTILGMLTCQVVIKVNQRLKARQ